MTFLRYESAQATGIGSLLLVTRAELAIALSATRDPILAEALKVESLRGSETIVMAHAVAARADRARLPEWSKGAGGSPRQTGVVLTGQEAISRLIDTFGTRNVTRRIWIEPNEAKGPDSDRVLDRAVEISKTRHIQKNLRRARIDADSFAHGRDSLRQEP